LRIDTAALPGKYGGVQLTPYNTGSTHVPTAASGARHFADLAGYPYDEWVASRGRNREHIVEPTIK
jgi:hypothetical protein